MALQYQNSQHLNDVVHVGNGLLVHGARSYVFVSAKGFNEIRGEGLQLSFKMEEPETKLFHFPRAVWLHMGDVQMGAAE